MSLYIDSGTDDYYVLEADLSSTGGYVNLINISVPISKIRFLGLISLFLNFLQTNWAILLLFVNHVCQFSLVHIYYFQISFLQINCNLR